MGIFDWFKGESDPPADSGLSRRAFFARVAGAGAEAVSPPQAPGAADSAPNSFFVGAFPFHDGPVLVPILRLGLEFDLVPEPSHPSDPNAVRIQWGRDHIGYVPAPLNEEVRKKLTEGSRFVCRVVEVNPSADLARVLRVDLSESPPPGSAAADPAPGGFRPDNAP
jgi:hypothetical protein